MVGWLLFLRRSQQKYASNRNDGGETRDCGHTHQDIGLFVRMLGGFFSLTFVGMVVDLRCSFVRDGFDVRLFIFLFPVHRRIIFLYPMQPIVPVQSSIGPGCIRKIIVQDHVVVKVIERGVNYSNFVKWIPFCSVVIYIEDSMPERAPETYTDTCTHYTLRKYSVKNMFLDWDSMKLMYQKKNMFLYGDSMQILAWGIPCLSLHQKYIIILRNPL